MIKKEKRLWITWLAIALLLPLPVKNGRRPASPVPIERVDSKIFRPAPQMAQVIDVIDGDTFTVNLKGGPSRVRLVGVNAPELGAAGDDEACFAEQAKTAMRTLLFAQVVGLRSEAGQNDRDKYGRLLRRAVLSDGTDVSRFLLKNGFARAYVFGPPNRLRQEFEAAEMEAVRARIGLWSPGGCKKPLP